MRYILCLTLLLLGCQPKKEALPTPFFPVRTAVAEMRDTPIFIESLGHVEPMIAIDVRSRIEGELTGVYFKQGQEVKKGDLLFTIDPRPYEAILHQEQGKLSQNLALFALAEEKLKRYKTLVQDEYYSQMDYETLQSNFASTSGLVQQNQGEVERAALDLEYCWIYAPIDGMMGILQIDLGNLVSADGQKPLVTLNQMAPIYVTFSVPEIQLPQIQKWSRHKQSPLTVLAAYESFQEETFEGSLTILDNGVDPKTGMIRLRATFENGRRELWPGQFVRTRLCLHTEEGAILIPQSAIQGTIKGPIAFVVGEDNRVELRKVQLGQKLEDRIIVLEGIREGEKVVVEGQINLFDGALVADKGER